MYEKALRNHLQQVIKPTKAGRTPPSKAMHKKKAQHVAKRSIQRQAKGGFFS